MIGVDVPKPLFVGHIGPVNGVKKKKLKHLIILGCRSMPI
jgi:hypothetical protein